MVMSRSGTPAMLQTLAVFLAASGSFAAVDEEELEQCVYMTPERYLWGEAPNQPAYSQIQTHATTTGDSGRGAARPKRSVPELSVQAPASSDRDWTSQVRVYPRTLFFVQFVLGVFIARLLLGLQSSGSAGKTASKEGLLPTSFTNDQINNGVVFSC